MPSTQAAAHHPVDSAAPDSVKSAVIRVGCAGWSLPRAAWPEFPAEGSHLERYATQLNAVEINSSFYRPHQPATYARWAASAPDNFRFAVKLPKAMTHTQRLVCPDEMIDVFLEQVSGLGHKLGVLLVQLPPSLSFDDAIATRFFDQLRQRHAGDIALEPRHAGWFTEPADALLRTSRIGRVLADPVLFDAAQTPGGFGGMVYVRLHGSPRRYYSAYAPEVRKALAVRLLIAASTDSRVWCIFDNTASGAATLDALDVSRVTRTGSTANASTST